MSVSENIVQTGGDDILKKWNKFGVSDDSNSFGKYSTNQQYLQTIMKYL